MTDTAAKRRAAASIGRPGAVLPSPDGDVDLLDRATLAGAYVTGAGWTYVDAATNDTWAKVAPNTADAWTKV